MGNLSDVCYSNAIYPPFGLRTVHSPSRQFLHQQLITFVIGHGHKVKSLSFKALKLGWSVIPLIGNKVWCFIFISESWRQAIPVITFKVAFSSVTFGVFDSNCQGLLPFISH
jgi:hypothetical protein